MLPNSHHARGTFHAMPGLLGYSWMVLWLFPSQKAITCSPGWVLECWWKILSLMLVIVHPTEICTLLWTHFVLLLMLFYPADRLLCAIKAEMCPHNDSQLLVQYVLVHIYHMDVPSCVHEFSDYSIKCHLIICNITMRNIVLKLLQYLPVNSFTDWWTPPHLYFRETKNCFCT